jgi:hypothetical protein
LKLILDESSKRGSSESTGRITAMVTNHLRFKELLNWYLMMPVGNAVIADMTGVYAKGIG